MRRRLGMLLSAISHRMPSQSRVLEDTTGAFSMKSIVLFAISIAAAAVGLAIWPGALKAGGPVINSFVAVPDCILPDPRRGILSYRVSGGIMRIRLYAVHHGGRVREFHSQSSGLTPALSMAASNVIDPGAASDIESYVLRVTGEAGAEVRGVVSFRYRRAVFDLVPPAFHTRVTTGSGRLALYQSPATIANVDSLSCSFKFDATIDGESGRRGRAAIVRETDPDTVRCEIRWSSVRKANAAGTVEWTAWVTDSCTQGRITRTARVNAIH
jgi:hypothetical protein